MNLIKLLYFHSIITLAAGIMLLFAPEVIPNSVGIAIQKSQYLVCYFLGCSEIAIAFLSFRTTSITDQKALQIIVQSIIVFHLLTAVAEGATLIKNVSTLMAINIAIRIIVSVLFYYYGVYKNGYRISESKKDT